jgi:NTP pyrophosphatase (non-canonical NTP hydrolase)
MTVQIREAVEVLDKVNPLQHVATVRKSQVQHALADMLTLMLAHSVAVDEPRWAMWSSLVHG